MKRAFICIAAIISLIGCGCTRNQSVAAAQALATTKSSLPEQIARQFAEASPLADPSDARARDVASVKLAECRDFRAAAGERILWGGFDPAKGYDPKAYLLTEFDPLVWLKLYASTIMFTGEHEVRKEGAYTVLEMKAKFRAQLDAGDYPYPFWHSPKKWQGYVELVAVSLVFQGNKIVAAYRITKSDPTKPVAGRAFDGQWQWTDAEGKPQPRVSLFSYVFDPDNPHRTSMDEAYRKFEAGFRAENCDSCHGPENKGKSKTLLMLNYPNQSLVGRHKLVQILRENKMPPEDTEKNHPAGIADNSERAELIRLAQIFVKEADAAVAFESSRKATVSVSNRK